MATVNSFLRDETGQDLIEFVLLIVFVLIASTIILTQTGSSMVPVWVAGNATVANAAAAVNPS
jgi:Flp pilus assembly pilin Flp